ncbi:hypothetical protein [Kingella pumchi]|jgi:hypothetical protein|uniref:HTH cro/C1-type domain-containing protein n=1 Tax=Kingella pumchi TaxID=2779506 RepID=A0ABS9NQC2_9NEIS|nr:hypothetical protein [Kingella pumchi]MCG6504996.1 hypothetical protein [Kingella pumchi]
MLTAAQWLNWYKRERNCYSDYQLARRWQVDTSVISQYRRGRLRLPLAVILEIAEATGAEPLEIITSLEFPRAPQAHRERIRRAYFDSLLKTAGDRMARQACVADYRWP